MRNMMKVAGFSLVLAACGGAEPAAEAPAAAEPAGAEPVAAAVGTTHDVNMVQDGAQYLFVPAELSIASGDAIAFHNVSGGPHNVQFFPDSIPEGAADLLAAGMPGDKLDALSGPLLAEPNVAYTITFAGTPAGEYKLTCLPHMALGMHGKVTVQ